MGFESTTGTTGSVDEPYTLLSEPAVTASRPVTVIATATEVGGQAASVAVEFVQIGTSVSASSDP